MTTPTIPRQGKAEDDAKDGGDLAGKKGKGAKDGPKKSKKKRIIIVIAVLAVLGAAYMFVLKPKPAATGAPKPGAVVKLDPLTLNLDGGHYLKVSMALQFTADTPAEKGGGAPDGSKALDLAIAQLSNRKIAELNTATARDDAKKKLLASVEAAYDHHVMDIYFTEFVMQ